MNKYDVRYYRCSHCYFIQTETPYWLEESYASAITDLDIGLVARNTEFAAIVTLVIHQYFNHAGRFLDFAGGYGLLVRMMRDKGFDYYRQDKYCENLFSSHFDVTDLPAFTRFELVSAFELFEHLPQPMQTIDELLTYSSNILFSTQLQPSNMAALENWWYVSPEIGQHVAIYHRKTLEEIARLKGLHLYSNHKNFHLLTRKKISAPLFRVFTNPGFARLASLLPIHRKTLLQADYLQLKEKIYTSNSGKP